MQKKIIAAALAVAASSAALAQSNVAVYGVIDIGYAHFSSSGKEGMNVIDNGLNAPSRLGFRGIEDLGNGIKALFTLEYNIAPDQNAGLGDAASLTRYTGSQSRQTFVGLNGAFGTVLGGRLQTAGYDFACAFNPVAGGVFNNTDRMKAATVVSCGTGGRRDNAVAYVSPTFGGVSFAVNHARVTESANTQPTGKDAYANLLAANYLNGPLQAGVIYSKVSFSNTVADDDIREYGLGASYDFQVVKAFALYQNQKIETKSADSKWAIGVSAPLTAKDIVKASYGQNRIKSGGVSNGDSKAYSLVYNHDLSKRTQLYAGWTHIRNETAGAVGFASDYVVSGGGNGNLVAAGITHRF